MATRIGPGDPRNPKHVPRILGHTPSEAVETLAHLYLHASAWGTPDFKLLDKADRDDFASLVRAGPGDLMEVWSLLATICIQHGVHLGDEVLDGRHYLMKIVDRKPLSKYARQRLGLFSQLLSNDSFRLRADEIVVVSEDFPKSAITGRWGPPPMTAPMTKKECAARFGTSVKRLIPTLKNLSVTYDTPTRERIRVAEKDWPAPK